MIRLSSIRARWLLTFGVLAATTIVLAVVGILALVNTRMAVDGFDEEILPNVAKSLALAERVAHLATTAPYIAEVSIASKLTQESEELRQRQKEVERLAMEITLARQSASGLPQLLATLHEAVDELIELKRQDLFLREDARAQLFSLGQLQRGLPARSNLVATQQRRDLDLLALNLQVALSASNLEELGGIRNDYERRYAEFLRNGNKYLPDLHSLSDISQGIFLLRQKQLSRQDRQAYLLASTRFLSDELTRTVNRYVATMSADVSSRKSQVTVAVGSGLTAVTATFFVAVIALLAGFWTLREALNGQAKVTSAMISLADGSVDLDPLPRGRNAEIAALVDAFEIFKKNTLAMRAMAQDIVEKQTLLQAIFDSIDDGLSVFDAEGKLVAWNPKFPQLLVLPPEAVYIGATIGDLQRKMSTLVNASAELSFLEETNLRRQNQAVSIDLQFEDGRILAVRSQPMPQGGMVTLYSDLSERRALELQIRQSQKMDVLGQLTGGVAHDFNNLLAAIVSNLQLLESLPDLSEPARRMARRALKASERGSVLTTRLLAFARKQPLQRQHVDVDQLIEALEDLLEYSLGQGIRVELALATHGTYVLVDGGQLENAILNLALNASAAMPKGGQLQIRTQLVTWQEDKGHPPRSFVEITVSDSGFGMPGSVLDRIFEPFFSTRKSEGSGLGLSIVYGFIKQSGGDIRVSSIVNRGTSFFITLPVADTPVPETGNAMPVSSQPVLLDGTRILLVEDDIDVRESTQDLLVQLGANVTAVGSSKEALQAMDGTNFKLLLSDVSLGVGDDGLSLMYAAQRLDPALRVLMMSGLPSDLLALRYDVPSMLRVLRKPFLIGELVDAISFSLRQP